MPYSQNLEPSRRWFAARNFMVQPVACGKKYTGSTDTPNPNELRLAGINVLRALRTLHRLSPDNNVGILHLIGELQLYLSGKSYTGADRYFIDFWKAPSLEQFDKIMHLAYCVFFDIYLTDKEYDLFFYTNEYADQLYDSDPEKVYNHIVEAGLASSVDAAKVRYNPDPKEAFAAMRHAPAFWAVIRSIQTEEYRQYHFDSFWTYDEHHSLERDYPTTYKGKNFIP